MNLKTDLDVLLYKHFSSRQAVADALGVSRYSVQRWLKEDRKRFMLHAQALCDKGVDLAELHAACEQTS